ncbi:NEL domain-containing protein [unidentified bacterial endosymbiont]|uniref:NEL domain-containing protein n=1 Tax=unidentified bacterial endosymbiont TaxID=2355 RepID=UPI00209F50CB|nr:NEL domain-containing protein [unidentified bacterial endosymbiont]
MTGSHQYHSIYPTPRQSPMDPDTGFERSINSLTPYDVEEACTCHCIQAIRATRQHNQPTLTIPTIAPELEEEAYPCHWIQAVSAVRRQYCSLTQWITSRVLSLPLFNRDGTETLNRGPQQHSRPARTLLPQNENSDRGSMSAVQDDSLQDRNRLPAQLSNTTIPHEMPESYRSFIVSERLPNSVNGYPHSQTYGETLLNNGDNILCSPVTTLMIPYEQTCIFAPNRILEKIFTNSQWGRLLLDKNSSMTQNFLEFLQQLALHHRLYPQEKLVDRLEIVYKTVKKDQKLWDEVLMEAEEGSSTCEDRALHYFHSIENRCLIYRLLNGQPVEDKKMFEVMRSLYRREKLQERVTQLIAQEGSRLFSVNRQTVKHIDEIEVQLYFATRLKDQLGLPGEDIHMRFTEIGKVRDQFLEQVAESIFENEQTEPSKLRDYIANNRYWQEYVKKKCCGEFADFLENNLLLQGQLDAKSETGEISSQEYLKKSDELMKNYQDACDDLVKNRSKDILQALC